MQEMLATMVEVAQRRKRDAAEALAALVDELDTLEAIEARVAPALLDGYYGVELSRNNDFLANADVLVQRARIEAVSDGHYTLATPGGTRVVLALSVRTHHDDLLAMSVDNRLIDLAAEERVEAIERRVDAIERSVEAMDERQNEIYYAAGMPGAAAAIQRLDEASRN